MDSLSAELLLLRKRTAAWILLGFWSLTTLLFAYLLPYYSFVSGIQLHGRNVGQVIPLEPMLPQNFMTTVLASFPFFGGTIVLILAVLSVGSEFSWGTLTAVFTQRASRLKIFFSKMAALGIALIPFVLSVFLLGLVASTLIALREGQPVILPPFWEILRAAGVAWFVMAVWASFGVLVSVLSRGTALAIGLGIIYGLVIEGIISSFSRFVDLLGQISEALLRTNSYSIVASLGSPASNESGPGGFMGTVVSGTQSFLVLAGYLVLFLTVAALLVRRRDVVGTG